MLTLEKIIPAVRSLEIDGNHEAETERKRLLQQMEAGYKEFSEKIKRASPAQ